jgi:hypothetical protein
MSDASSPNCALQVCEASNTNRDTAAHIALSKNVNDNVAQWGRRISLLLKICYSPARRALTPDNQFRMRSPRIQGQLSNLMQQVKGQIRINRLSLDKRVRKKRTIEGIELQ